MGHVRSCQKAKTLLARAKYFVVIHCPRWASREIIHAHIRAHETTYRGCLRSFVKPLVERTAFVCFEMAETDPTTLRWINHARNVFPYLGKDMFHSCVK